MRASGIRSVLGLGLLAVHLAIPFSTVAGGSGLNTIIVVNQNSANSCELGNYFAERREVPPENFLRITWPGGNVSWTSNDFQAVLLNPLLSMLTARQLTNQIDYVVLSMDIPFQTVNGAVVNSTTAALFYGLKVDSGPEWQNITNSYVGSEGVFQQAKPATAPGFSFLATMITADSLPQAKQLVDQGVNSDGTFPSATVVLAKSSDPLRNVRYHAFDNAIFNARIRGDYSIQRVDSDSPAGLTNLLGYETGLANFNISPGTFVPGAMADSLTSFAGVIFGPNSQTTLLAFINAGAAGSYGTVAEPSPDPRKFPDPQVYFYQARGFSLAEAYYQSIAIPYQGLIVGEPLAAPFARAGSGKWFGIASNAVLSGVVPLTVRFSAATRDRPLRQVDLFLDGKYFRTLTNLPPLRGNALKLTLNGYPASYSVPANATLSSIATDLAALINSPAASNANLVALPFGDRVELRSALTRFPTRPAAPTSIATPGSIQNAPAAGATSRLAPFFAAASAGTAAALNTSLGARRSVVLDSAASGTKACSVSGTLQVGTWLQMRVTKTNGAVMVLTATNQSPGATPFDLSAQLVALVNASPALQAADGLVAEDSVSSWFGSGLFNLRARTAGYQAALIQAGLTCSTGLVVNPSTPGPLTDNLADLQPRNHLYVTAGTGQLNVSFTLDTTALPDGFHELTAVAYEGSHTRTQTRVTLPVQIHNSNLTAALDSADLTDPAPVSGTYHFQVTASGATITRISLYSTGGVRAAATNQPTASFTFDGTFFGAGRHPVYALIQTTTGAQYRTATRWVELVH